MALWLDLIPKLHRSDNAVNADHRAENIKSSESWDDEDYYDGDDNDVMRPWPRVNKKSTKSSASSDIAFTTTSLVPSQATVSNRGARRTVSPRSATAIISVVDSNNKNNSRHLVPDNDVLLTRASTRSPPSVSPGAGGASVSQRRTTASTSPLSVTLAVGCTLLVVNISLFCAVLYRQYSLSSSRRRRKKEMIGAAASNDDVDDDEKKYMSTVTGNGAGEGYGSSSPEMRHFGGSAIAPPSRGGQKKVHVIDLDQSHRVVGINGPTSLRYDDRQLGTAAAVTSRLIEADVNDVNGCHLQLTPLVDVSNDDDDSAFVTLMTSQHATKRQRETTLDGSSSLTRCQRFNGGGGGAGGVGRGGGGVGCTYGTVGDLTAPSGDLRTNSLSTKNRNSILHQEYRAAVGLT